MSNVIDNSNALYQRVLVLNAHWVPIAFVSVKRILEDMNALQKPKKALKIEYKTDTDSGVVDFQEPVEVMPLSWQDWITIKPRSFDPYIIRTTKLTLRVPTVAIVSHYDKIPIKTFSPTKRNLYNYYKGICYWTGKKLSYHESTIEHIVPKSKGGKNSWQNLALCHHAINRKKGDKSAEEFMKQTGLKPHYKLSEPKALPVPLLYQMQTQDCPDWKLFLQNNK